MFDIETWLPFLLAKSHQISFSLMKPAVEPFNLTPPQFATLSFLWRNDGINLQELGALMCTDRTTIGEITSRLEKLGYIVRKEDPKDRRSHVIHVSNKGLALQSDVLNAVEEVKEGLSLRLSKQEQVQLVQLLTKFRRSL